MAAPLNSAAFSHDKSQPTNSPLPPSREPSIKRSRGLSTSSNASISFPVGQRPYRAMSPWQGEGQDSQSSSPDQSRRPSFAQHFHARQASQPQPGGLMRSHTAGAAVPPVPVANSLAKMQLSSSTENAPSLAFDSSPSENSSTWSATTLRDSRSSTKSDDTIVPQHQQSRQNETQSHDMPTVPAPEENRNTSVGDFVQAHLIASFIAQANEKIGNCPTHNLLHAESYIEQACRPDTDPRFDRLLRAIGHTASEAPKDFIESVVLWYESAVEKAGLSHPGHTPSARLDGSFYPAPSLQGTHHPTFESLAAERRAILATCLLCRVLIQILKEASRMALPEPIVEKLHDLIYTNQFRIACAEGTNRSTMRQARWDVLTQLLGVLFEVDFEALAAKVLQDLRGFQKSLGVKGAPDKQAEAEAILLMKGLRENIRLPCETEKLFLQSCRFVQNTADLFCGVHGSAAKEAYCRFLGAILLPLAGRGIKWLDQLTWRKTVSVISERLGQLATKPKYWQVAFPVQATLICVSPYDVFNARWREVMANVPSRLRERNNRAIMLQATCRLYWVYLQRTADLDQIPKHLDDLTKTVFFPSKKYILSKDPAIAEPLIYLLRIIGNSNQELCFRTIIFPLMGYDVMVGRDAKDLKPDQLDPDRAIIGIRAFIHIVEDLEKRKRPPFPLDFDDQLRPSSHRPGRSVSRENMPLQKSTLNKADQHPGALLNANLSPALRDYCGKFCDMVGKTTLICDSAIRAHAAADERHNASTPKTPIAETWSFNRRDEVSAGPEDRCAFVELLLVAIRALPRCLTSRSPLNALLSVLCASTARSEEDIALSAGNALKSVASQGQAQIVVDRFSGFISGYDTKLTGLPEATPVVVDRMHPRLTLYVELLRIWVRELREKTRRSDDTTTATRTDTLDVSSSSAQVDRVESQGLLFLCSPSPKVRNSAIDILRLVTELDASLSQNNTRIMSVIESESQKIMSTDDKSLSVAQRVLLERDLQRRDIRSPLISLCCSDIEENITLWYKVFPRFIEAVFIHCPIAVAQTRQDVCTKLAQMQSTVEILDDRALMQQNAQPVDVGTVRHVSRHERRQSATSTEITVEQWKVFLMFACKTLTKTGQPAPQDATHTRKSSRSSQNNHEAFTTATDLFCKVIPLLSSPNRSIRQATVAGLGSISLTLFRTLLQCLDSAGRPSDDGKRQTASHQRAASSPRRSQPSDFAVEIAHVYKLTSHFLQEEIAFKDEWILHHLSVYTRELAMFLHNVEKDREYHALRLHFCGLIEGFFVGVNKTTEPHTWMPFQTRRSTFSLMETWSGFRSGGDTRSREPSIDQRPHSRGFEYKQIVNPRDWAELQNTALSAMATLCAGPLQIRTGNTSHQFDAQRIMQWIHSLFNSPGDQKHAIGKRALSNVIAHNTRYSFPLEKSIEMFYVAKTPQCLESYVEVVSDAIMKGGTPNIPFWKIVTALLFTISRDDSKNRMMSARLLRKLDENDHNICKLQDLDISIADRTPAVHRKAQFEITRRLAAHYPEHAFHIFSEFSKYFKLLHPDDQRNFVHALLPWLQTIELQVTITGAPTASSYMLLANLLEITLGYSAPLQHEIQGLWQALATGPHAGNVKSILDFVINLCLDRRDSKLVEVARQIIVFLSETPAGQKLIDALLLQIEPRTMTQEKRQRVEIPPDAPGFPYLADLPHSQAETVQWTMSLGQLCLILLVDLIVAPQKLPANEIPALLQVVLVLWDHHTPLVQEQARELLIHLIHELVISELGKTGPVPKEIEEFIDLLRSRDKKVVWSYEDNEGQASGYNLSEPFQYVVTELVRIFATTYPDIQKAWGKITLEWGTQCPVRHLACRSLQIYRCMMVSLERKTVSDLVSRLAITIADDKQDVQIYALELMRTIRTLLNKVGPADVKIYPQLFWATCACLDTSLEREYSEALAMLEVFLGNFDLGAPEVHDLLVDSKPPNMSWSQDGLSDLILRGCTSSVCVEQCLGILAKLVCVPSNEIVGNDGRLLITILANLPRFTKSLRSPQEELHLAEARQAAPILANAARQQKLSDLQNALERFAGMQLSVDEFLSQMLSAIKVSFFPALEAASLTFQMGLLMNARLWFKEEVLTFLNLMLSEVDICRSGIPVAESDFVSPLLRLLDTELSSQAISVLDKLSKVSGRPTNLQVQLDMSMAAPRSNREARKRFEDTPSIFGIPQESGWSVPRPIQCKDKTKTNLAHISAMFANNATLLASAIATPEVEFYREESDSSYFRTRTGTMTSDEATLTDTNMGELASKLDTLDDFFEDDDDDNGSPDTNASYYSKMERNGVQNPYSHGPLFDGARSPASEASLHNRSYQSSYSSRAPPTPREPAIMEPSAFAASPPHAKRPAMAARSITSPADHRNGESNGLPVPTPPDAETLSDDDVSFGGGTSDGSFIAEGAARPLPRSRPSLRSVSSRLRRLTGSDKGKGYRNAGGQAEQSPEVPKVPDVFLQNPKSSEL